MSVPSSDVPAGSAAASGSASARQNALLRALSSAEFATLQAELQPVYLPRGTSVGEPGSALSHVFFPVRGVVSLGQMDATGQAAEVAIIGRDGVIGVEAFLGAESASHRALAQTACLAYRLSIRSARAKFEERAPFYRAVLTYALDLMLQMSQTSICNLHHTVEQRLCRALLQSAERLSSSNLPMTQDVLASLVNGRRQGVSEALQKLRDLGLIASGRGNIVVLDRPRLLAHACECYNAGQVHRERLLAGI